MLKRMTRLCRGHQKRGQKALFHVERGDPASRILACRRPNDLMVTTTHGAGGFSRWIFGSMAEKLIHQAPVPVLVYKADAPAKEGVSEAS